MKKLLFLAMCLLAGCYAPLINSGISTNKAWLEIPAKKVGFDEKQYDSCYQFRVRFVPSQAAAALEGQTTCIDSCCWRSDQEEVVWDFNKDFEQNLRFYGRAEAYTPAKITLKISHSNLLNTTSVHVSPRGAISANGTVKLKRKTIENPARLAQLKAQSQQRATQPNAAFTKPDTYAPTTFTPTDPAAQERAVHLVKQNLQTHIDRYFYQVNQTYRKKGYIFLVSNRIYQAAPLPNGTYRVSCYAQMQSGPTAQALQKRRLSCGVWKADVSAGTVSAADGRARQIQAQTLTP